MASILRSGKFLRVFAGFTRNVVVNTVRDAEGGQLFQNTPCICGKFQHGFANVPASNVDLNLDRQLRRLDNDVRRVGRIARRDIEDVLDEIRLQRSATSSQSLLVIRCCGSLVPEELPEVRTTLVQEIWKTLNALNVPMDISHYNALLRVYLENEHSFSPTEFLAELEAKGIEPNRVTYQRLIARYCQDGDIEGATRILEFMRNKNLPVNETVFNSLILGHSKANDLESAKGVLSVMKQTGLEPSADTYTTLLCGYALHGDVDAILTTLAECEKDDIYLLDKDLLDVIYNLAINGHGDKIDVILPKLRISAGYNQDAVNTILRLVNKEQEDVGFKILRTMPRGIKPDGQPVDVGGFFIKQLIKANRPLEKILSICKTLHDEGLNPKALLIATETGLHNGLVHTALPLLKEMKKAGLPVRQHYFWPVFCSSKSNEIIQILRSMPEEFSLYPNSETLRDYVIPNLGEKNWERVVTLLRDAGVANGTAAASSAYAALVANNLKDAAKIMNSHKAVYSPQLFKPLLIQALSKTNDYASFVRVTRQLYESVNFRQNNKTHTSTTTPTATAAAATEDANAEQLHTDVDAESAATSVPKSENENSNVFDVVGSIIIDVSIYFRRERVEVLEKLLPALVKEGLSISSANATRISEGLGSEMTTKLSELLGKLSSNELELAPLKQDSQKRSPDALTVEELERYIANLEAKGDNTDNLKRHLLNACFRTKNLEKTLQTIEKLQASGYQIHNGINAQLIDLYTLNGKTDDALSLYNKIREKDNSFLLDNLKAVHLLEALLKEDRLEDALKLLDNNKKATPLAEGDSFNYITSVWRILNTLAESGNADRLQCIFDALLGGNYIVPNNVLLGPLVKVQLIRDDVPKAMQVFEDICEKYKTTPWKNELACRLIQNEDANNLQKLTDLSTSIHGEVNSLYDLVFSFIECGRTRQARKILETPGLRTRPHRFEHALERYKKEGMVEPLERLVEATKNLNHIDRNKIYYNLLLSYCNADDVDKALSLWTKMQEDNVPPSEIFLLKLADLLQKHKREVPFVFPTQKETTSSSMKPTKASKVSVASTAAVADKIDNALPITNLTLFRSAIKSNDLQTAVNLMQQFGPNDKMSVLDTTRLIEQLLRVDQLSEAIKYVDDLLANGQAPQQRVFKFFLNKLAASGDLNTMQRIGQIITDDQKKQISFDNRYCHAIITADKVEQYFQQLDNEISNTQTPEEVSKLAEKFPRGGILGILEKYPHMVDEFEKLAEKFAAKNQLGPMNMLWVHLMSQGNTVASKAIWSKYLSNAPRLMFQRVLQTAREQKDVNIANTAISQLRESKISEGAIGNAYSCLIDIHVDKEDLDKALDTLKTALKDVCLENINRTALMRLKVNLEAQKKSFPYTIPEKGTKMNSSSSAQSSDDDVKPKRPETRPTKPTA